MLTSIKIVPLKGKLPKDWTKAVAKLVRPYTAISEELYLSIMEKTKTSDDGKPTDFILFENKVCTFGHADNGFALMPLQWEDAEKIKKQSGVLS